MKKIILLVSLFLLQSIYSQEKYSFVKGGKIVDENFKTIDPDVVRSMLKDNAEALELYNTGRNKKTIGNIFLIGGATLFTGKLLYDLVAYSPERVSTTLYFVSGAMIIAAIPIKIGFSKKIKAAVDVLNTDKAKKDVGFHIDSSYFVANQNGFGVGFTF